MSNPNWTTNNPETPTLNNPRVVVVEGDILPDDELGKYLDDDSPDIAIWTDYEIENRYEYDYHRYMMGISSPNQFQGGKAAFVQLASPTLLWISDWTACRFYQQPTIPDPNEPEGQPNSDWVLLDIIPETFSVDLQADGVTPLYRISGIYVYGHKNPSTNVFNYIAFGRPAWLEDTLPNGRRFDPNNMNNNIIGATPGGEVIQP